MAAALMVPHCRTNVNIYSIRTIYQRWMNTWDIFFGTGILLIRSQNKHNLQQDCLPNTKSDKQQKIVSISTLVLSEI